MLPGTLFPRERFSFWAFDLPSDFVFPDAAASPPSPRSDLVQARSSQIRRVTLWCVVAPCGPTGLPIVNSCLCPQPFHLAHSDPGKYSDSKKKNLPAYSVCDCPRSHVNNVGVECLWPYLSVPVSCRSSVAQRDPASPSIAVKPQKSTFRQAMVTCPRLARPATSEKSRPLATRSTNRRGKPRTLLAAPQTPFVLHCRLWAPQVIPCLPRRPQGVSTSRSSPR